MRPISETHAAPASTRIDADVHRFRFAVILGGVTAFAPFATDTYLAGLGDVVRSLSVDAGAAQMTVSVFFVGMAFGQLLYGPAIDRWGRKGPLLLGIALFTMASVGLALTSDFRAFVALRFVQALGGCAGMIVARAIIADVWDTHGAAAMFGQMMLVQGLGPVLAPILGAAIVDFASWRWIFAALALYGAVWFVAVRRGLPETLPVAARHSAHPIELVRASVGLLGRADFVLPMLVAAISMGGIAAFIGGSAFVFMEHFGLGRHAYALVFGGNAVCMIVAARAGRLVLRRFAPSEAMSGATVVAAIASLALLTVASDGSVSLFVAPLFLTLCVAPIVGANAQALAMSRCGDIAGIASSLIGVVQLVVASLVIAVVGVLHDGTTRPMVGMIAACQLIAVPIALAANPNFRLGKSL